MHKGQSCQLGSNWSIGFKVDIQKNVCRNRHILQNFTEKHVLLNRGRPPEDFPLPSLDWIVVSDIHFIFFKISEICLFSALIVETYNLSAKPIKYVIPFIKTELLLTFQIRNISYVIHVYFVHMFSFIFQTKRFAHGH